MDSVGDGSGILYPSRLPSFRREPAPDDLAGLVRWFWIPRWDLAPGRTSRQTVLPFPAANLVVQPDGVVLAGPATRVAHRDLRGSGWAVGALLRPAAVVSLCGDPRAIRDTEVPVEAPGLHRAVSSAMRAGDDRVSRRVVSSGVHTGDVPADVPAAMRADSGSASRRAVASGVRTDDDPVSRAVAAYVAWVGEHLRPPDDDGRLANAMEDLVAGDRTIVRVGQVAERLGVSVRAVQRLARRHVGLSPLAIIRRYRLQDAAQRLRTDPSVTIAQVAAELGYADQAHLSRDFRDVLDFTPTSYRHDTP